MYPRTRAAAKRHQQKKRQREISLIVDALHGFLRERAALGTPEFTVLEFGCGHGYQLPYLTRFGTVVASDIRRHSGMDDHREVEFHECPVQHMPFADGRFDLVFSNHVMQYIPECDLPAFFREMKRIGKPGCLYAFSVPTNLWLTLAVPAQYYEKFLSVLAGIRGAKKLTIQDARMTQPNQARHRPGQFASRLHKFWRGVTPQGSGSYHPFTHAWPRFRVKAWIRRFESVGFKLETVEPLLLYSPSEWPVVPVSHSAASHGCASSVLLVFTAPGPR